MVAKNVGKNRAHSDLNRGPLDLQSNALPLSYTPCTPVLPQRVHYHVWHLGEHINASQCSCLLRYEINSFSVLPKVWLYALACIFDGKFLVYGRSESGGNLRLCF